MLNKPKQIIIFDQNALKAALTGLLGTCLFVGSFNRIKIVDFFCLRCSQMLYEFVGAIFYGDLKDES